MICDWCKQEIKYVDETAQLPVHPLLVPRFGQTVTVHTEDCMQLIEEEMYTEWEKIEFGDETVEEASTDE